MILAASQNPVAARRATAIVNSAARRADGTDTARLEAYLGERYGVEVEIAVAQNGEEIAAFARLAARDPSQLVIAAGGDGTVNAVAAELIGSAKQLAVLPLGTLNHFAKDLGIPLDLEGAAQVAMEGRPAAVDVASVNGRIFLNNSSLGLYPRLVEEREEQQELGRNKWLAWLPALWRTLRQYPVLKVRLDAERRALVRRAPIVFVGNNRYELEGWGLGSRACLDGGMLHVSILGHEGPWGLARLLACAMVGQLERVKEFDTLCSETLWVETRRKRLSVALDGEVLSLPTPLRYRIHPRALTVMIP